MGVMDFLSFLPTYFWVLVVLCLLVYLYGIWPYITSNIQLDGPKPSPFFGTLLQQVKKGHIQWDRDNIIKYGDIHLSWGGRRPVINVADPDVIKQVCIKDFSNFTNRPDSPPSSTEWKTMLTALCDDQWKFVRSILTPSFSSGKMRRMVPLIDTCISRLMTNLEEHSKQGDSFEVKRLMGGLSLEVIGAVGFGIDTDVQKDLNDKFLIMAKRVFEDNNFTKIQVMLGFVFPFLVPVLEALGMTADTKEVTDFFVGILKKTIKERRQNPSNRKDVLQLMIDSSLDDVTDTADDHYLNPEALKINNIKRDKKLTDIEVTAQALIFLIAGFETTASTLAFLGYNLAMNPDCQDKLIQEIDDTLKGASPTYDNVLLLPYLDMCLNETLRLYPVVRGLARKVSEATVLGGVTVPAEATVIILGFALHHDKRYWTNPETFDPNRFSAEETEKRNPYVYLPFGHGPRNCVGMRLAKMEAKMAMVSILQRYKFIRAPETEVPLTLKKSVFIQAEKGIWLRVESR